MVWSGEAYREAVRHETHASSLTALQIESWQLLREEWAGDADAQAEWAAWQEGRTRAQPEMAALASRFLAGTLDADALRAVFDQQTRTRWDAFGLRGVSGAMFLNRLVKHARATPLAGRVDVALRTALALPVDSATAAAQLTAFSRFVREAGAGAQPALATAFVSAWWHLQHPAVWPAYQPSMRQTLAAEDGVFVASGDPARDYVAFRAAVLALGEALALHPWALEHLCWWQQRRDPARAFAAEQAAIDADETDADRRGASLPNDRGRARRGRWSAPYRGLDRTPDRVPERAPAVVGPVLAPDRAAAAVAADATADSPAHTQLQWLLARLGRRLGCRVWIAANDHHRTWQGERLGACSVPRLPPLGLDADSQRLVELIDVVWLRGSSQVAAAFEIECTTSVHSGLLRMADLAALAPNLAVPLYVVVPEVRLGKVRRELRRPALQALELHRRCGFFSAEALVAAAPEIARWASGPEAIARLAERVAELRPVDAQEVDLQEMDLLSGRIGMA